MDYSTTELIRNVKRRATIPTNQSLFTNADIIAFAEDEMRDYIVPLIREAREDYYVTYYDHTLVNGTKRYRIPSSAVGMALRDVVFVNTAGHLINIPRLSYEKISSNPGSFANNGFYIEDEEVVLVNDPGITTLSLRMYYERRTNHLVATSACGQITAINTGTNELTLGNVPLAWVAGTSICVVSNTPMFRVLDESTAILTVSSPTIGITSVTGFAVGDWLALEGESPIPQIPVEGIPLLAQAVAVRCLVAMNDTTGIQVAQAKLEKSEPKFVNQITPRVSGQLQKVTSNNSLLDSTDSSLSNINGL